MELIKSISVIVIFFTALLGCGKNVSYIENKIIDQNVLGQSLQGVYTDTDGNIIDLDQLGDKVTVLIFAQDTCQVCSEEATELSAYAKINGDPKAFELRHLLVASVIDKVEFLRGNTERLDLFNKAFEKNPSLGGKLDIVTIGVYFGLYTIDEAAVHQKKAIDLFFKEKMSAKDMDILCTTLTFQKGIYLSDEDINSDWMQTKIQQEAAQCIKRIQVKPVRDIGSVKKKAKVKTKK